MPKPLRQRSGLSPALVGCGLILLAELVSATWYWKMSQGTFASGGLSFIPPLAEQPGWKEVPVDPAQVGKLKYDRCRRYHFHPSPEVFAEILSIEYDPGSTNYEDAFGHPVEICTSYAGFEILQQFPSTRIAFGPENMDLNSILAEDHSGRRWFIFKTVWLHNLAKTRLSHRERLALVMQPALPGPPALILMASISGVPDYQQARDMFEKICLRHVSPVVQATKQP